MSSNRSRVAANKGVLYWVASATKERRLLIRVDGALRKLLYCHQSFYALLAYLLHEQVIKDKRKSSEVSHIATDKADWFDEA